MAINGIAEAEGEDRRRKYGRVCVSVSVCALAEVMSGLSYLVGPEALGEEV